MNFRDLVELKPTNFNLSVGYKAQRHALINKKSLLTSPHAFTTGILDCTNFIQPHLS